MRSILYKPARSLRSFGELGAGGCCAAQAVGRPAPVRPLKGTPRPLNTRHGLSTGPSTGPCSANNRTNYSFRTAEARAPENCRLGRTPQNAIIRAMQNH
jgi:hypothetical protein